MLLCTVRNVDANLVSLPIWHAKIHTAPDGGITSESSDCSCFGYTPASCNADSMAELRSSDDSGRAAVFCGVSLRKRARASIVV